MCADTEAFTILAFRPITKIMQKTFFFAGLLLLFISLSLNAQQSPVDYVNPFIGTFFSTRLSSRMSTAIIPLWSNTK